MAEKKKDGEAAKNLRLGGWMVMMRRAVEWDKSGTLMGWDLWDGKLYLVRDGLDKVDLDVMFSWCRTGE